MEDKTPLTDRKVMRRGLIAGLAGFGAAALLKISGTPAAEANDNGNIVIGVSSGTTGDAQHTTRLTANPASPTFIGPVFEALNGGSAPGINGGLTGVANSSNAHGVYGINHNSLGFGTRGASDNGIGVFGQTTAGVGVRGDTSGSGTGVDGKSGSGLGVRGTSTSFVGVIGISTSSHGVYGFSNSATSCGVVAENLGGGPGLIVTGNAVINGSLQVTGAKNAVIKMQDGTDGAVYCQEAPEPYFEDFGRAQLAGGVANVPLEREFASLVAGNDYMVFTHPEGDTRGLFVSKRGPTGFEVRESQGGTSNASFTYRIVTRRKDIEGKRFDRVNTEAAKRITADRARLGVGGSGVPQQGR